MSSGGRVCYHANPNLVTHLASGKFESRREMKISNLSLEVEEMKISNLKQMHRTQFNLVPGN